MGVRHERTHDAGGRGAEHLRRPEGGQGVEGRAERGPGRRTADRHPGTRWPSGGRSFVDPPAAADFLSGGSIALGLPNHRQPPQKTGEAEAGVGTLQNKSPKAHECRHTPTPAAAQRGRPAGEEEGSLKRPDDEPEGFAAAADAIAAAGAADARSPTRRRERLEACMMWRGTSR